MQRPPAILAWLRRIWNHARPHAGRNDLVRLLLERDEMERMRVAHSVHDGLGLQLLALRHAATQAREHPLVDPALQAHLDSITALASASLETARGIAYRLRPFELDQLGVQAAIEAMVAELRQDTELRVFHDLNGLGDDPDPLRNVHLFRLVQEGLLNVTRHAHASAVMLEITREGESLVIQIEDDGVGFDPTAVRPRRSGVLGLARMGEHARALGGELVLSSAFGRGTRLRVRVPQMFPVPRPMRA